MKNDLEAYHKSISAELIASKDRIRNLIGDRHWSSDGTHKEVLLRNILKRHAPPDVLIGHGFVCIPESWRREYDCTHQSDIIAIGSENPILFREENFFIVTPDCVRVLIEVKTKTTKSSLKKCVEKLSEDIVKIKSSYAGPHPHFGIFIFEDDNTIENYDVLNILNDSCAGEISRAINWIALGKNRFFRF